MRHKRYLKLQDKRRLAEEKTEIGDTEGENLVESFEDLVPSPTFGNTKNAPPIKISVTTGMNNISVTSSNAQTNIQIISQLKDTSTMTDTTEIDNLSEELKRMLVLNKKQEKLIHDLQYGEECFENNDQKVRFFTGLHSWCTLNTLFKFVEPSLNSTARCTLSPFQQLILTLTRLRLNLSGLHLSYIFQISPSTSSRIFVNTIDILHKYLKSIIMWPTRDVLKKTMPMVFRKHFPNCVAIIDCFEIFIDSPANPRAQAETFSSYKHHNTVKYLIAITPQGTVSFISEGWGGRSSDKVVTESCGILEHLVPGDLILADRGFDIKESIGLHCATLTLPAFTRGKAQLSGIEVEQTRRIANCRIHVERVIGNIRSKYQILSSQQPIEFLVSNEMKIPTLDKIVVIACALNNLCPSVIPID